MGQGLASWLVPGWMDYDKTIAPHIPTGTPSYVASMIAAGEDPKPMVLEECKPLCTKWKNKLERCETLLEVVIKVNPTKTCLYPMRDYVNCVEACTQPTIHNQLKGAEH